MAAASACLSRPGASLGAQGPTGAAPSPPAGSRGGRWRVRAARAARCPGEGRGGRLAVGEAARAGGKQKLVVSLGTHSPLLGSGPRPALIWKTRVSPPRGAGSPAARPALRGAGPGVAGAAGGVPAFGEGKRRPPRPRRAQGRESPTGSARPSGRQLLRGTGPNFAGPSGPPRAPPRAPGTLTPAAAACAGPGPGGCPAEPRRPAGPRPRASRARRASDPPSPSAASGRPLTWLPGRARAAAGGTEAPRAARAGAATRGSRGRRPARLPRFRPSQELNIPPLRPAPMRKTVTATAPPTSERGTAGPLCPRRGSDAPAGGAWGSWQASRACAPEGSGRPRAPAAPRGEGWGDSVGRAPALQCGAPGEGGGPLGLSVASPHFNSFPSPVGSTQPNQATFTWSEALGILGDGRLLRALQESIIWLGRAHT